MRPRFSLCNLLLATVISALAILAYHQATRLGRLELELAMEKAVHVQTQNVLQKETQLRHTVEETRPDQQRKLMSSSPFFATEPLTTGSRNRTTSLHAGQAIRRAKLRVAQERALLREVERIAERQLAAID